MNASTTTMRGARVVTKRTKRTKQRGVATVEFALFAPLLVVIVIGVVQFGWMFSNYVMVANAASAGARYFAAQRGTTTPLSSTQTQVGTSAALLTTSKLTVATSVNGATCTSDSACAADLTSAGGTSAVGTASVTVSYTFVPVFKGSFSRLYTMLPTTLSASAVERVQ